MKGINPLATQASSPTIQSASRSVWRAGLIALVVSLVVNNVIRLIAVALLSPSNEFMALAALPPVTLFTVVGVVGATIAYALLRRFTANPNRVFTILALVLLVVSIIPDIMLIINPAAMPGATSSAALVLLLMHFTTAYICWRFLTGGRA